MTKIVCPHCGYDGSRPSLHRGEDEPFLYLEDIVCYRRVVIGENNEGVLHVDGYYQTGEGFDDGDNPRLMCGDCLSKFSIPSGTEIDFI